MKGAWLPERAELEAGSLFVPVAQPAGRLAVDLLEPEAPDSFLAWGFFNAHFERKEYMEAYVTERFAAEALARDPALLETFQHRLETDPEFARDGRERLDFFARRHPSWDSRYRLYPVMRVDALQPDR